MGDKSHIEWTDATWNPVRGCSLVSAGCTNCYAMKTANRQSGKGRPYEGLTRLTEHGPVWTGDVRLVPELLDLPLRWKKPRRIFVNSMSDLFHEKVPDEFIDQVFAVMALAPRHTFQVLTKRAERMARYFTARRARIIGDQGATETTQWNIWAATIDFLDEVTDAPWSWSNDHQSIVGPWPLPNVHLGVSVEDQKTADERIPLLLQTPAAVRWISAEPLLGPLDLHFKCAAEPPCAGHRDYHRRRPLHWVVVGGESGPGARPFNLEWARQIIAQCRMAGVPCFVKQLGTLPYRIKEDGTRLALKAGAFRYERATREIFQELHYTDAEAIKHSKGGDWNEWPEDLRVREFPNVAS